MTRKLIRLQIKNKLETNGYEVIEAGDATALRNCLAGNIQPDVVLLDLKLPGSNGLPFAPATNSKMLAGNSTSSCITGIWRRPSWPSKRARAGSVPVSQQAHRFEHCSSCTSSARWNIKSYHEERSMPF